MNASQVLCRTPPSPPLQLGFAMAVSLSLYGVAVPSSSFNFHYYAPQDPAVLSVSPISGQWLGGLQLTISGTAFQITSPSLTSCRFILSSTSPLQQLLPKQISTVLQYVAGCGAASPPASRHHL